MSPFRVRCAHRGAVVIAAMLALGLSALVPRAAAAAIVPAFPASAPPGGTVFVSDSEATSILEYAPGANGNVSPLATITGSNTGLNRPHGMALNAAGDLFVANTGFNSVIEYAAGADGNATPMATISGSSTGLENPIGVALDSAGKLYVANSSNVSVTEYASGANGNAAPLATISLIPLGADELQGIAVDPKGDVFVTANDTIYEFAPGANGNATPIAAVSGPDTGLGTPNGPVLNPAGDLFVANFSGTQSVTQYSAGANGDATPATTITGADTGLNSPDGVALDSAGHVFASNSNSPSVTEYATGANGDAKPIATIEGSSTGLSIPTGVVVAATVGPPRGTHISLLKWNPNPVAPPASLAPGATVNLTVTALDARALPIPDALIYVSLSRPPGSAATAKCGTKTLPAYCQAGAGGTVAVAYHSSLHLIRPAFKGGTDTLTAAVDPFGTLRADDGYTYPGPGPVTRVSWDPSPIAPAGSLAAGQTAHAVVTVLDAAGSPVPKGTVYLKPSLVPGGSGTFTFPAHCVVITPTPGNKLDKCPAGPAGQVSVSYSHGAAIPPGGSDAMLAAALLHATPVADLYSYSAAIDHLRWTPSPVAPAASLAAGATVNLTVTALNADSEPVTGTLVYLSISRPPGSTATAKCGTKTLPAYCQADDAGTVAVTYHSSGKPIRSGAFKGGTDVLTAAVDPFGTLGADDGYTYAGPGPVTRVSWNPSPIAPAGSLAAGHTADVVVTALDAAGSPVPKAGVFLKPSLVPGGSGTFTIHAHCVTVTVTPRSKVDECLAGSTGQISVTYSHGVRVPPGGSDAMAAAGSIHATPVADLYSYSAAIDHLRWTPSPVAPAATLAPGTTVHLTVKVLDAGNRPISDALVYVSLSRPVGSMATAKCGSTTLPAYCKADSRGRVAVSYHASPRPTRPGVFKGGTDLLIAAVDPFGTRQATDGYTYAGPGPVTRVSWDPSPVAAAGSLRAGHAVGIVVTALDAAGSPVPRATIYLNPSLDPGGSGKFTVHANCVTVTVTPGNRLLKCLTGATGQVSVTYAHGKVIPAGGSDGIGAATAPRAGLVWDVYTYL